VLNNIKPFDVLNPLMAQQEGLLDMDLGSLLGQWVCMG
jgi:hypothetical protein